MAYNRSACVPTERSSGLLLSGAFLSFLLLVQSCGIQYLERKLDRFDGRSEFLKAHLPDGRLVLFRTWVIQEADRSVRGSATVHSADRKTETTEEDVVLPFDSVALFETNVLRDAGSWMWAATVMWGIASVICISSPKVCFGSCPTFYVSDGTEEHLMAEGFSASIAPALEDVDIDALPHAKPENGVLSVRMKNEALETHIVRHVKLLLVPKPPGGRVFRFENSFFQTTKIVEPIRASASEGDILPVIRSEDRRERFSASDSTDLLAREIIELEFPAASLRNPGLVITARQSLLSTYVFYQAIAYLGESYVAELARMDSATWHSLSNHDRWGISVSAQDGNKEWKRMGTIYEAGPLAPETHLLPLSLSQSGPIRVRLELGRGHWRIDRIALAELDKSVEPIVLDPEVVLSKGVPSDDLRRRLVTPSEVVVTQPGDEVLLQFRMPAGSDSFEYFLSSRGYYFEWMREEWLKEENPQLAWMIFTQPEMMMRYMASGYKKIEKEMEKFFWRSRYAGQKN